MKTNAGLKIKRRLFLLFLALLAVPGLTVEFAIEIKGAEGATNILLQVEKGAGVDYLLPLPEGYTPSEVKFTAGKFPEVLPYDMLNVGINEYASGRNQLYGAVNDALTCRELFLTDGGVAGDCLMLTNSFATKSAIRGALAAEAQKLEPGEGLIYTHSSHGVDSPEPSLAAYDEYYSFKELAEDLALFSEGVKVIVVLDTCHAGGLIPDPKEHLEKLVGAYRKAKGRKCGLSLAKKSLEEDVCFLAASEGDQTSAEINKQGLFTGCLKNYGRLPVSDGDGNGVASFLELFNGAKGYIELRYIGQNPVISNEELASAVPASQVCYEDGADFVKHAENGYSLVIPSAGTDMAISLKTAPVIANLLTIKKFLIKSDLREGLDKAFSKVKVLAWLENFDEGEITANLPGILDLNGEPLGCAIFRRYEKNTYEYRLVDKAWNFLGYMEIKPDRKNGRARVSMNLAVAGDFFSAMLELKDGEQKACLSSLLSCRFRSDWAVAKTKYKPLKSFKAVLKQVKL